jgi:uncharacterized peroxidase-related enzyme
VTTLPALDLDTAPLAAHDLLRVVRASYGTVPALIAVMANSPALLRGYLELASALERGSLPIDVRERIAIVVAEQNGCMHCLAGHSFVARRVAKLPADEVAAARRAESNDDRVRAVLGFAAAVNAGRGAVTDEQFAAARAAGVTEAELAEIVGHVAVKMLTNYLAKTARVSPQVPLDTADDDAA